MCALTIITTIVKTIVSNINKYIQFSESVGHSEHLKGPERRYPVRQFPHISPV